MRKVYEISSQANFTTGDKFAQPWSKMFVTWLTDEVRIKKKNLNVVLLKI